MKDKEGNELVIKCAKINAQLIFDEKEDEGYSDELRGMWILHKDIDVKLVYV